MNIYVSEAAIPQIEAIRYCTVRKKRIRVPPFRYLGYVLQRAVFRFVLMVTCKDFPHTPVHHNIYTSLAFALFPFYLKSIYHQIAFETRSKHDICFSSSEAKSRKKRARGASSGALRGRLRRVRSHHRFRRRRNHRYTERVQCTGI